MRRLRQRSVSRAAFGALAAATAAGFTTRAGADTAQTWTSGNGAWSSSSWLTNGANTTWANSSTNDAVLNAPAGSLTIDGETSGVIAGTIFANANGYTIYASASNGTISAAELTVAASAGLTLDLNKGGGLTWNIGSIDLISSGSLTLEGSASGSNQNRIDLNVASEGVSAGAVTLNGTGAGPTGFEATSTGVTFAAAVTSSSNTSPANFGASSGNDLTLTSTAIIGGTGTAGVLFAAGQAGGAGLVTIDSANTYSGPTLLNNAASGIVKLGAGGSLPSGTSVVIGYSQNAGALDLNGNNQTIGSISSGSSSSSTTYTGALTNSSSTPVTLTINGSVTPANGFAGIISGNLSLTQSGANTIKLSGSSAYTGATTVDSGTLQISSGGLLSGTSGVAVYGGELLFSGGSSLSAVGNVNVYGGTLALTGGSVLSGPTAIGVSGGSFGGNGTVAGAVTVGNGGTLFEGASGAGSLTVNNSVTMQSGSNLLIKIKQPTSGSTGTPGTDNDLLMLTGVNTFAVGGSTLTVSPVLSSFTTAIPAGGYTYTIVEATAGNVDSSQPFANLAGGTYNANGLSYTVSYSGDEIQLDVNSVPEPTSFAMFAVGGAMLLRRRRASR